uniref:Cleavage and polyadenylation specificity factor subunit 1 n=1 Tax=Electrophorus electricus TaxID=8005 RepID=A0A4W4H779_ELEEL
MYAVYRQAHYPTAVEFSVYCNFISSEEKNLVVAGTSQLYVYRTIHDYEVSYGISYGKSRKEKLEQVASFSLFGNVMSMASVQLVGTSRDALLLSFKDAKLSVVEYDPGTHDLKTLSLHFFEEPELRDGFVQNVHIPMVRVDPENRCAVMLVYGTQLVVLPFRKDTLTDEQEGIVGEGQKSSFLPSYIIDVRELDEKLLNIIDMKFLHGYYEPTLLILYEPNQTWPGRVAVRQDTCSIVAISLNIMQKVHPVIWSLSNLPFDCMQVMAVPKPIGGVVVFAVNSLLYLNQSVPPFGVSLNSQTNGTTAFPLRVQEEVKLTLDCSQATFISSDKMVISLKGGEIYVLTLITDGMRSVRAFHFDKAAASVLTTCMVTMEPGCLFLGSRLGNSLLLKYTEKLQETPLEEGRERESDKQEEPPNKKKRVDSNTNWTGKAPLLDELDEIEVYGSEAQSGTQLATYSFEVCDSILNIGPCVNASMGEPAFLSEEFQSNPEPDLEVVVCSGYGKNGALSVLQRSIRPQVVTTFELPGCHDMWTVISSEEKPEQSPEQEKQEPPVEDEKNKHGFLILSREDSTMVSPMGLRLLEGVTQLHFIPVDLGSPIVQCSVADPYVVVMTAEGVVTMFVLKSDVYMGKTHRLALQKPQLHTQSRVITLCTYRDVSGMFTTENKVNFPAKEQAMASNHAETETVIQDISTTVDDEEEMLYGESSPLTSPSKEETSRGCPAGVAPTQGERRGKQEPTHWCLVVRENVLVDSSAGQSATQGEMKKEEVTRQGEIPLVKEVVLVSLGYNHSRPYLLVCSLLLALFFSSNFSVMPHNINFREKKSKLKKDKKPEGSVEEPVGVRGRVARFRYFEDISGYSGVFICGPSPHWMFVTSRGAMRLHPMTIDGPIESFSPFHNINCPKGFLYFNKQVQVPHNCGLLDVSGEEVTCRGRILILDVIEVVPEPGQPLTKNKFKVLYEKEQKGPVTALCHCNGYLVSAIGQKIFLWSLKDNDLTGMAFIDTQLYIHQMYSIKNFILAADVMKSISLLRYQEESKTLSLVSRDAKPLEVYSIEFMVDNGQLGFLVSDRDKNLLVYMYLPEAKESFGGMRLLRRADFNVGAHVNTFWRMPCRGVLDPASKKALTWDNKHITWFATLDGGVGLLLPMPEKTYRRLLMLQNALTTMLPHHAGLNPKAFRMLHTDRRTLQNAVRNILDGELLNKYLYLSTMERSELAKKIGTTSDIILEDLLEIDRVTAHF